MSMKFSVLSRFLLIVSALLITTHRSPAPISEVETPSPTPKGSPTATESADKAKIENRNASAPEPSAQLHNIYAGTWKGTLNWGLGGTREHVVVIDAAQTSVTITNLPSGSTFPTSIGTDGISWVTGVLHEHKWLLKPLPDGKTAFVTVNGHNSTVFRRER